MILHRFLFDVFFLRVFCFPFKSCTSFAQLGDECVSVGTIRERSDVVRIQLLRRVVVHERTVVAGWRKDDVEHMST